MLCMFSAVLQGDNSFFIPEHNEDEEGGGGERSGREQLQRLPRATKIICLSLNTQLSDEPHASPDDVDMTISGAMEKPNVSQV